MSKKKKTTKSTKKKPVIHVTRIYFIDDRETLWSKVKAFAKSIVCIFKRK